MQTVDTPAASATNAPAARRGRKPKAIDASSPAPAPKRQTKAKAAAGSAAPPGDPTKPTKAVYDVGTGAEGCGVGSAREVSPIAETVIIKLDLQASALDVQAGPAGFADGPSAYNGFDDYAAPMSPHGDVERGAEAELTHGGVPCENHASKPHDCAPPASVCAAGGAPMKAIRLLMDFDEKCKNGEWPASTSVHCYWCCHRFGGVPIGIPLSYNEDLAKFMVYGCFCSCECAAAYNLDSHESSDEIMVRHGYLNMLARELGHRELVRPAPNRLVLNMFGGPMSIEEFRERCHTSRLVIVNFPPMMTVTQQVEEINQRELRSEYRYIPLDAERVNKYREKIKLKRTKPLVNFKNTLDHTMNLRFT